MREFWPFNMEESGLHHCPHWCSEPMAAHKPFARAVSDLMERFVLTCEASATRSGQPVRLLRLTSRGDVEVEFEAMRVDERVPRRAHRARRGARKRRTNARVEQSRRQSRAAMLVTAVVRRAAQRLVDARRREADEADEAHLRTVNLDLANAVAEPELEPEPAPESEPAPRPEPAPEPEPASEPDPEPELEGKSDDPTIDAILKAQSTTVKAIKEHRMMKIAEKIRIDSIQERAARAEDLTSLFSQNLAALQSERQAVVPQSFEALNNMLANSNAYGDRARENLQASFGVMSQLMPPRPPPPDAVELNPR